MFHPDLVSYLIIANGVHPVPFQREMAAGGAQTAASQYILSLRREGSEDHYAADSYKKLQQLFSANMDFDWFTGAKRDAYLTEWARPGRLKTMIHWYRASPLRVAEPGQPITDLPAMPADKLRVAMPHLLIWGDGDTALLPESIEGLEDYAPRLTVRHIPDADHWICHQQPRKLAALIHDWIAHEAPTEY
jgi:pimeloyl-ACP methyl ester carboxylesterase